MSTPISPIVPWRIRGAELSLGGPPRFLGIVNATPDSFSDGGRFYDPAAAVDQALHLQAEGADLLDLGGESTRPGSEPVTADEELRRVIPVLERLAGLLTIPLSIDTTKALVAREALAAGAHIVNDISGLTFDPAMLPLCVETKAGVICNHMQGTPATMQLAPHYDEVVTEIAAWFTTRAREFTTAGLNLQQVVWDPGIGFGKTPAHNLAILGSVARFRIAGRPVLIGHSRKRFLQKVIGRAVDERLYGTIGVTLAVAAQGAELIRVHDVAANRDAWLAYHAVMGDARCLTTEPDA